MDGGDDPKALRGQRPDIAGGEGAKGEFFFLLASLRFSKGFSRVVSWIFLAFPGFFTRLLLVQNIRKTSPLGGSRLDEFWAADDFGELVDFFGFRAFGGFGLFCPVVLFIHFL